MRLSRQKFPGMAIAAVAMLMMGSWGKAQENSEPGRAGMEVLPPDNASTKVDPLAHFSDREIYDAFNNREKLRKEMLQKAEALRKSASGPKIRRVNPDNDKGSKTYSFYDALDNFKLSDELKSESQDSEGFEQIKGENTSELFPGKNIRAPVMKSLEDEFKAVQSNMDPENWKPKISKEKPKHESHTFEEPLSNKQSGKKSKNSESSDHPKDAEWEKNLMAGLAERVQGKSKSKVSSKESEKGDWTGTVRSTGVMLVVLGLVACLLFVFKVRPNKKTGEQPSRLMEVVERLPLGPRREIILLKVGERRVVMANMQNDMKPLAEFSAEDLVGKPSKPVFQKQLTKQVEAPTEQPAAALPGNESRSRALPENAQTARNHDTELESFSRQAAITDLERAGLNRFRAGLNTQERQLNVEIPPAVRSYPVPAWPEGPEAPVKRMEVTSDYPKTNDTSFLTENSSPTPSGSSQKESPVRPETSAQSTESSRPLYSENETSSRHPTAAARPTAGSADSWLGVES